MEPTHLSGPATHRIQLPETATLSAPKQLKMGDKFDTLGNVGQYATYEVLLAIMPCSLLFRVRRIGQSALVRQTA